MPKSTDQVARVTIEIVVPGGGPRVNAGDVVEWYEDVVEGCRHKGPSPFSWSNFQLKALEIVQ